jgi:hypothetical protein
MMEYELVAPTEIHLNRNNFIIHKTHLEEFY